MSDLKNLDLESVEALLEKSHVEGRNGKDDVDERRHKKKKHRSSRSRSRSRSKSHKKKSRKRSKSKSRDRKRKDSKSKKRSHSRSKDEKRRNGDRKKSKEKERDRSHDQKRSSKEDDNIDLETIDKRQKERIEKEEEELKKQETKQVEEKLQEAKKQLEEARRDDSTVLVLNLSIKSEEKEIYQFFNENNCGKIRDIRVIRDPRSGKSKGVAYLEFYGLESVNKAVAISGKELQGSKLKVLPSKAEINRTAAAAKQMKQTKNPSEPNQPSSGAMRIFVSGLTDQLADIEEKDLRDLFSPFGDVENVEMHRDDVTGKSKGYAFILFRNSGDAKRAIIEMDGFVVNGKKIKVQPMQAGMANMFQDSSNFDLDDESGNNYLQTVQSRNILMQKLQRDQPNGILGNALEEVQPEPQPVKYQTSLLPTNCILLSNMFDINEVDLQKDPGYFVDLREEIEDECKSYGDVEQVFIEASSEGNIWVKFGPGRGASTAYQTLNNKFFSGRKIICSYVTDSTFNSKLKSM